MLPRSKTDADEIANGGLGYGVEGRGQASATRLQLCQPLVTHRGICPIYIKPTFLRAGAP